MGAAGDGDALSGAVDSGRVEGGKVVYGGEIARREEVAAADGVAGLEIPRRDRSDAAVHRLAGEAVQGNHTIGQIGESARQRRIPGISPARLAVDHVVMDGGMKGTLHLGNRA